MWKVHRQSNKGITSRCHQQYQNFLREKVLLFDSGFCVRMFVICINANVKISWQTIFKRIHFAPCCCCTEERVSENSFLVSAMCNIVVSWAKTELKVKFPLIYSVDEKIEYANVVLTFWHQTRILVPLLETSLASWLFQQIFVSGWSLFICI